ncbi:MAG: O-antigen ligase family protein [Acidobacteria bacterium]|nr:O-antigen ligase family protein [Acidobacteriota bacterium]
MGTAGAYFAADDRRPLTGNWTGQIIAGLQKETADVQAMTVAIWCVPLSIAVAEFFLSVALLCRIIRYARGQDRIVLPRAFWYWLAWAGLTCMSVGFSPEPTAGWHLIRRLLLVACLFLVVPAIRNSSQLLFVWKGVFVTSAIGSLFLIGDFISRWFYYRGELSVGGDPGFYLRTGGLLNHWMVWGTVEVVVLGGMLAFIHAFPLERWKWLPAILLNGLAILLSLTRMIWIASVFLLGLVLILRRSRWVWALPATAVALYFLAPGAIGSRLRDSVRADYYSNFERVQMLRVGWSMIKQHPFAGVGAGQIEKQYHRYLAPHDPIPAYHGHLHNNLVQTAAESGLPVAAAAMLFCAILFMDIGKLVRTSLTQEDQFLSLAALLALCGFLLAGCFDYTYGHSLGLILLSFGVIPALSTKPCSAPGDSRHYAGKNSHGPHQASQARLESLREG